jgi:hypothetical protein
MNAKHIAPANKDYGYPVFRPADVPLNPPEYAYHGYWSDGRNIHYGRIPDWVSQPVLKVPVRGIKGCSFNREYVYDSVGRSYSLRYWKDAGPSRRERIDPKTRLLYEWGYAMSQLIEVGWFRTCSGRDNYTCNTWMCGLTLAPDKRDWPTLELTGYALEIAVTEHEDHYYPRRQVDYITVYASGKTAFDLSMEQLLIYDMAAHIEGIDASITVWTGYGSLTLDSESPSIREWHEQFVCYDGEVK